MMASATSTGWGNETAVIAPGPAAPVTIMRRMSSTEATTSASRPATWGVVCHEASTKRQMAKSASSSSRSRVMGHSEGVGQGDFTASKSNTMKLWKLRARPQS
jgi:hypothetical protein